MITETGRVVAVGKGNAWVQAIRASACESCSARSGCGQRVLAAASSGRANQVLVGNNLGARVGDQVTVAVSESALLSASLLVYALPLLLLVLGAMAGQQWYSGGDAGAIAGSAVGLAAGFAIARFVQARSSERYQPTLIRILPGDIESGES